MDEHLRKLKQTLREEICPPHVLEKVQERIKGERPAPMRILVRSITVFGCALLALALILTWSKPPTPTQIQTSQLGPSEHAQVVRDLKVSLALVGNGLRGAGERTQSAISKRITPRLLQGLEQLSAPLTK